MATSNLKRIAAQTFATWLEGKVPELVGKTHTVDPSPNDIAGFPCVAILPTMITFNPFQAAEVWSQDPDELPFVDDGKTLMNIGEFTGGYELRVYAKSVPERERLEDKILHALMAEPGRHGVVSLLTPTVTVNSLVTLYQAPVAFMLDRTEWEEEFAFENRRFSFIELDVAYPALVTYDAYTIFTMVAALTNALDSDTPVEQITVDDDGITSLYP